MSQVVVDTDVISFLFKNHPIGSRYDPELAGRIPLVSFYDRSRIGTMGDSTAMESTPP